jgi:putative ABC transport system permease protein
MRVLSSLRTFLDYLLRRSRVEDEMEEEFRSHLRSRAEDLERQGLSRAEAERQARVEFGGYQRYKEECREALGTRLLGELIADVRYGLRQLRRNPGFTVVAVSTLALGIGGNTAIFSVVNGVLLKPLPYPRPQQLVDVSFSAPKIHMAHLGMSASMYFVYRQQSRTFEDIGLYGSDVVSVSGLAEPERVKALDVTDGLLPVLGVRPVLGRLFTQWDDLPESPNTAMLTYGYWQSAFGGDRSVIGKTIDVNGRPREIIGVLPRRFSFLDEPNPALVLPIKLDRAATTLGNFGYGGIARLKPGVGLAQANADVARMLPIVARSFPAPPRFSLKMYESSGIEPNLRRLKEEVVGNVGKVLWILMGGIGLVLLIACANVANLLLVRVEGRRKEFAIRAALGASGSRIGRQLLLESLSLSLPGGVLGLAFAYGALPVLITMAPSTLPRLNEIRIDGAVLWFTVAVSLLAGLLFGSMPILKHASPRLAIGPRVGARSLSPSSEQRRARDILATAQIALALVLLVSSGLMIRTFRALRNAQPGFDTPPSQVQTFHVAIAGTEAKQPDQLARMEQAILEKVEAIPGVSSAGISTSVPMDGGLGYEPLFVKDRTGARGHLPPIRWFNFVSPGFFRTIGTPLIAGRRLTWNDIQRKLPVVLVSANLAREYWHNPSDAIGKQIRMGATDEWHEIVGVVGDIHDDGMNKPAPAEVHWPLVTTSFQGVPIIAPRSVAFAVRSAQAGSASFMKQVRQAVWSVDPNLPISDVHTLEHFYGKSMARTSFTLVMLAIAGGMALLLGAVGLYGVISYMVAQRTHEIGIRMALGAQRIEILKMIVGQGLRLALIGVVIGIAGALALTRFLSSLLYGVKPTDPLTFISVSLILIAVALLACYIPALRATKVDPLVALRYE